MRKTIYLLGTLAIVFTVAACDTSTPGSTMGLAAQAARKGNLNDLRAVLTGEALAQYGTPQGMLELQKRLAGYEEFTLQNEAIVRRETGEQGYGHTGDILRVISGEVYGNDSSERSVRLFTAETYCHVYWVSTPGETTCTTGPNDSEMCTYFPGTDREGQDCLISRIR